jgi:DNA (cytosine-5)-methyltransferase 1
MRKSNTVSLFTGAGGLDVGFAQAGFETIWANDLNADACATFERNHKPEVIRCGPLEKFIDQLEDLPTVDVLIGGPPCQGFSVAGYMDLNDPRSELVYAYMDALRRIRPRAFVLENVKALATLAKFRPIRERLLREARAEGYNVELLVVRASDFGVPQARERMLIVGFRDQSASDFVAHLETQRKVAPKLREAIAHLGRAGSVTNPRVCKAKVTIARRPILRASPYAGMLFNGQGRPLNPDGYASTLPATMGGNRTPIIDEEQIYDGENAWVVDYHAQLMKGGKPLSNKVAPERLRRLTLDEAAAIQTFPPEYEFAGRSSSIYAQIGNAVPCELARRIATSVNAVLEGYRSNRMGDRIRMVA